MVVNSEFWIGCVGGLFLHEFGHVLIALAFGL